MLGMGMATHSSDTAASMLTATPVKAVLYKLPSLKPDKVLGALSHKKFIDLGRVWV